MRTRSFTVAAAIALTGALVACGSDDKSSTSSNGSAAIKQSSSAPVKLGLITKFPVDFYLAMKSAARMRRRSRRRSGARSADRPRR